MSPPATPADTGAAAASSLAEGYNFAGQLLELNRSRGGKIAYLDDYGTLSYGALGEQVRRLAGLLIELGLRPEERVLLLMHDTSHWPVSFLGCLYAGIVPVAVNTLLTADDYAYMLRHSRAPRWCRPSCCRFSVRRSRAAWRARAAAAGSST